MSLRRTPLFDRHVALDAKIVPFAGFEMPVQYPTGITAEHRAVRSAAGIFDVSHMGEFRIRGPQALDLVQYISINDAARIEVGQAQYSAMCREDGGILDDLLIYRFADHFMLVVNAANLDKDLAWIRSQAEGFDVEVDDVSEQTALIALQGPKAREILRPLASVDIDAIHYYRFAEGGVAGCDGTIAATGYTGEDGFELYLDAGVAPAVWDALLEAGRPLGLVPAGLGARDTLRLEMGYALYGNDLDEAHTPWESALGWVTKLDKGDFIGRAALAKQKEEGIGRRLTGLRLTGRGFPRPGYAVLRDGEEVGVLTSGTMSPSLGVGIALARIPAELAAAGTELEVDVRGRRIGAVTQRPPFYTEGSIRR